MGHWLRSPCSSQLGRSQRSGLLPVQQVVETQCPWGLGYAVLHVPCCLGGLTMSEARGERYERYDGKQPFSKSAVVSVR